MAQGDLTPKQPVSRQELAHLYNQMEVLQNLLRIDLTQQNEPSASLGPSIEATVDIIEHMQNPSVTVGDVRVRRELKHLSRNLAAVQYGLEQRSITAQKANNVLRENRSRVKEIRQTILATIQTPHRELFPGEEVLAVRSVRVPSQEKRLKELRKLLDQDVDNEVNRQRTMPEKDRDQLFPNQDKQQNDRAYLGDREQQSMTDLKSVMDAVAEQEQKLPKRLNEEGFKATLLPVLVRTNPSLRDTSLKRAEISYDNLHQHGLILHDQVIAAVDYDTAINPKRVKDVLAALQQYLRQLHGHRFVCLNKTTRKTPSAEDVIVPLVHRGSKFAFLWMMREDQYHVLGSFKTEALEFPFGRKEVERSLLSPAERKRRMEQLEAEIMGKLRPQTVKVERLTTRLQIAQQMVTELTERQEKLQGDVERENTRLKELTDKTARTALKQKISDLELNLRMIEDRVAQAQNRVKGRQTKLAAAQEELNAKKVQLLRKRAKKK